MIFLRPCLVIHRAVVYSMRLRKMHHEQVQAGDVLKVEFFQGDTKIGEDLTPPYHQSWASLPLGTYQLTTKATLRTGGNSTNPPSVTSPPRRITVVDAAAVDAAAP